MIQETRPDGGEVLVSAGNGRKRKPVGAAGDDQGAMDAEDAAHRLRLLVAAVADEAAAAEVVKIYTQDLRRAKSKHRQAKERLRELSFVERRRQTRRDDAAHEKGGSQ